MKFSLDQMTVDQDQDQEFTYIEKDKITVSNIYLKKFISNIISKNFPLFPRKKIEGNLQTIIDKNSATVPK